MMERSFWGLCVVGAMSAFACEGLLGVEDTHRFVAEAGGPGAGEGGQGDGGSSAVGGAMDGGAAGSVEAGAGGTRAGEAGSGGAGEGGSASGEGGDGGFTGGEGGEAGTLSAGAGGDGTDGGAGGRSAGASNWSPDELAGLVLWLEPNDLVGNDQGFVEQWPDRSVHQHVASQPEPAKQPLLLSEGQYQRRGVKFDGSDDFMAIPDHESLQLGTLSHVIEVVFYHTTPPAPTGTIVLSKPVFTYPFPGIGVFANRHIGYLQTERLGAQLNISVYATTPGDIPYNDGQRRVFGVHRWAAQEFAVRVDGKLMDYGLSDNPIDISAVGSSLNIAGSPTGKEAQMSLRGVINEIVIAREVSDEDVANLEAYLVNKYREEP